MGAINTTILILSSLTMAMAVTYAQLNRQTALLVCLILTFLGACGFMIVKYFEYADKIQEGILPGAAFYEPPANLEASKYWNPDLPIIDRETLLALRIQEAEREREGRPAQIDRPRFGEVSSVAPAAVGPAGFDPDAVRARHVRGEKSNVHPLQDPNRPINAHMFFNIYFMMTGLHGIHVLVGMIVIGWLIYRAALGHFGSDYFTPVDLGGLYWHIVDLIWIFLFPLFYLI
ncbi:MAG: cytochrome c oxidase subunit 3 family protein [Phycisphaerales bacterium]|nr:MAG: cytochrome c oxidase subunit 3 family protein [Phycisphaerales bacterium]